MALDSDGPQPAGGARGPRVNGAGVHGQGAGRANGARRGEEDGQAGGADEALEGNAGGARRGRAKNLRNLEDIPPVHDQTGEKVRESFEHFLEK